LGAFIITAWRHGLFAEFNISVLFLFVFSLIADEAGVGELVRLTLEIFVKKLNIVKTY